MPKEANTNCIFHVPENWQGKQWITKIIHLQELLKRELKLSYKQDSSATVTTLVSMLKIYTSPNYGWLEGVNHLHKVYQSVNKSSAPKEKEILGQRGRAPFSYYFAYTCISTESTVTKISFKYLAVAICFSKPISWFYNYGVCNSWFLKNSVNSV